jgi:hypothetical protein
VLSAIKTAPWEIAMMAHLVNAVLSAPPTLRHRSVHVTAILLVLVVTDSAAALDTVKVDAITKAADTFVAMTTDPSKTGQPLRQSDPAIKPLLDLVLDISEIRYGPVLPFSAIDNLVVWLSAVIKTSFVYNYAGTGLTFAAAASNPEVIRQLQNDPDMLRKASQNIVEFAPEMGRCVDALLWLERGIAEAYVSFLSTLSKPQMDRVSALDSVATLRTNLAQTLLDQISMIEIDGLPNEWRRDRLIVLAATAPQVAKFLLTEDVRVLRDSVTELAGRIASPELRDAVTSLAAALPEP